MEKLWFSRERTIVIAAIVGAVACAWAYLLPASLDMYGNMDGAAAWMMMATWDTRYLLLIFVMWAVMMVGMMLPSALPTILLFRRIVHQDQRIDAPTTRVFVFVTGYLAAWVLFSAVVALLQRLLATATLLSPMMVSVSPWLGGAVLLLAGIYQWTPLKKACIAHCRSPLAFFVQYWRPGVPGAFHLGFRHGLYCVGCCWALMMLLFVGGVMNLLWIAAITAFVLLEKLAPYGAKGGRLSGVALVAAGLWVLVFASLR